MGVRPHVGRCWWGLGTRAQGRDSLRPALDLVSTTSSHQEVEYLLTAAATQLCHGPDLPFQSVDRWTSGGCSDSYRNLIRPKRCVTPPSRAYRVVDPCRSGPTWGRSPATFPHTSVESTPIPTPWDLRRVVQDAHILAPVVFSNGVINPHFLTAFYLIQKKR